MSILNVDETFISSRLMLAIFPSQSFGYVLNETLQIVGCTLLHMHRNQFKCHVCKVIHLHHKSQEMLILIEVHVLKKPFVFNAFIKDMVVNI